MMKLTLSVPLIWMLFSTAEALKCVKGLDVVIDGSNIEPCDSPDDQCLTVAIQDFFENKVQGNTTKRTCAPSSLCSEDNQLISISIVDSGLTASLQCCSTDDCNSKDIPFPDEQKPNNLTCFNCYASSQSCNQTLQCVGIQDRCITVNVTERGETHQLQGCASANLCEGDTDMKFKALTGHTFKGDGSGFSAPKCCGTSLCN